MADNTIDTLVIKIEGQDETGSSALDKLINKLGNIQHGASGASRRVANFTKRMSALKSVIDNLKPSKFNAFGSDKTPSSVKQVTDHLNNLKDTVNDLNGTETKVISDDAVSRASKFSEKLSDIKDDVDSSSKKVKSFGDRVKTAFSDSIVGRFGKKVKETIGSLGRIALYRFMRSIIKEVTDAFSTGINNMYQYSLTFGGSFSQSMDRAASAMLSFKNSIGAAVAPLIEYLVPYLDKAVDKLMAINNTIAEVIAGLTGKSTFSKAVRVTTQYADAADKAAKSTTKVKDTVEKLSRSFAGIDEITVIGDLNNNNNPASTLADTINDAAQDYSTMFVETPVNMTKVDEIKEKFDKILKVAKWIGIAIAAWKLATFISSIGQAISSLGTLSQKIVGISMMVVGFGIEFAGAYDMGRNGINLKNALLTALGASLGVAGSLLTFGTTPVGWAIGLGVALTVMVAGYVKGQWDKGAELAQMTEQYKAMTEIIERAEGVSEQAQQALQALNDKKAALDTTFADFSAAQVLVEAIFDIYEKSDLSAIEIAELQTKIEALNGLNLDGLQLEFDESSGTLYQIGVNADGTTEKIAATRDSVRELTESLKEQAITAALTDLLTESYKRLFEAQMQVEQADSDVTKAQEALNDATTEYQEYLRNTQYTDNPFSLLGMAQKMGYYSEQIEHAQEALDAARTAQEDNDSVLESSQGYIDAVTNALISMKTGAADYSDPATKSSDILNSSLKDGDENVANLKSSLKAFSLDSVLSKYADGSSSSTKDLSEKIGSAKDQSLSLKDRLSNFKSNNTVASFADRATDSGKALSDSLINANNDALKLRRSLSQLDGFSGTFSYNYSFGRTPQYATGGFPEDGFFFANHNELVGQFSNGKTAVANNEQIVEGISEGVAAANREQNTLLREQNGLLRELLQKDSSIPVSTIVKAFNQKNRRDGKVTVPVAT